MMRMLEPFGLVLEILKFRTMVDGTYDEVIPGERIGFVLRTPDDPAGARIVIALFAVTRDISELELAEHWGGSPPSPEDVDAREARWRGLLDRLVAGIEPSATLDPDA